MQGFFSPDELEDRVQVEFDFNEGPNCLKCGLFRKCNSPKMKYTGEGRRGVLIIAEAPGQNEDQLGTQLVGEAGQLLRQQLEILKLNLDRDFWKMNALSCRPTTPSGANRKPTKVEIQHCKPLIDKTIQELQPRMIWLMGGVAVESFYMNRFKHLAINRWRKLCIPDRKTGAWVVPLFHPSYINRNSRDDNLRSVFERDLKWAASCLRKPPFDFPDERESVVCLYDIDQITTTLKGVLQRADNQALQLYIDYETNCLKPQWPGSKIASIAFCTGPKDPAIAFPYQYYDYFDSKQRAAIKFLWRKICTHPNISMLAHNLKFEDAWTRCLFGIKLYSWQWDTMIAAHILDNRSDFSGLKFQSYIHFGIEPYNKHIDPYLRAKTGHFNRVDMIPISDLLLYNGLDTKLGMMLYDKQQQSFSMTERLYPKNKMAAAYSLFHRGILAFSDIQMNGICIDEEYYNQQDSRITQEISTIKTELSRSPEAKKFKDTRNKELDLGSNKDLGILFYEILGIEAQRTDKDNYKVDVDALDSIKIPFVEKLLRLRKLEKAKSTYFAQLLREVCNGKIYPFYDLHIPRSFRSSSSRPNWQNIPSHDPEIGELIRKGIFPSKGNQIMEADYSNIEVRCAAIYTEDPVLIAEVTSDDADMHRDTALDVWMLPLDELNKNVRYLSKAVNFGQFYGASYKSSANVLWKGVNTEINSGITLEEHLKNKGIKTYAQFESHCGEFVDKFWNERFKKYQQWKDEVNEEFRKKGYIENKFGFRFTGYMTDRVVSNYPIQSTAFHILLDSLTRINEIAKREKWKSKMIGQIHDSILIDLVPEEQDHVLKTCIYEMSEHTRELYPWITVPIPVEIELTEIDQPWYTKKEVKL